MVQKIVLFVGMLLWLGPACRAPESAAGTPQVSPIQVDPATHALLAAAGDGAALVALLRPAHWPAAAKTLRAALPEPIVARWKTALEAPDLWTAVVQVARSAELQLPASLSGFDATRPIVAALFEPDLGDVAVAARALVPNTLANGVPGLRFRLILPATDAPALARALAAIAGQAGWQPLADVSRLPALQQGSFHPLGDGFVAFIPAAGMVRVEICAAEQRLFATDNERYTAWNGQLAAGAQPAQLPRTPALTFAASRPELLVLYARPWQLRALGSQVGARLVVAAVAMADPSMKAMLLAQGLAEVSNGYLWMSPRGAEFDDLALALALDQGLRLTAVASLTPAGARVLAAGQASGQAPPAPRTAAPLLAWQSRLDTAAMVRAAVAPPALAAAREMGQISQALYECGVACSWHMLLRVPFGTLQAVSQVLPVALADRLPQGMAVVVTRLELADRGPRIRGALAARYPRTGDLNWLTTAVAELAHDELAGLRSVQQPGPDVTTVFVTLGADPQQIFTPTSDLAPGVLQSFVLDVGALADVFRPGAPDVATALARWGRMRTQVWLDGPALVAAGTLALCDQPEPALPEPARGAFAGLTWESPGLAEASTKGALCLEEVTRTMRQGFAALAAADPADRTTQFQRLIEEAQAPLACALAETDTRETARRVQAAMALFLADRLGEEWRPDEQRRVLEAACHGGHAEACTRAAAVSRNPPVTLASLSTACGDPFSAGSVSVVLPVRAAREDAPTDLPAAGPGSDVALAVDAAAPAERALALAATLAQRGFQNAQLVWRGPDGRARSLAVQLQAPQPGPPPSAVPPPTPAPQPAPPPESGRRPGAAGILGALHQTRSVPFASLGLEPDSPPLLVEIGADFGFTIRSPRGDRTLSSRPGPDGRPQTDCAALLAALALYDADSLRDNGIQVHAESGIPWAVMAEVLGQLACRPGPADHAGRPTPLRLGARPQPASPAAALQPAEAPESGGTAILQPDTALPGVRAAVGDGPGLAPRQAIAQAVKARLPQIQYCYERALLQHPDCQGTVTVRFTIAPDGQVTAAEVAKTDMSCSGVDVCIVDRIRRWRIERSAGGASIVVNYPFKFRPE